MWESLGEPRPEMRLGVVGGLDNLTQTQASHASTKSQTTELKVSKKRAHLACKGAELYGDLNVDQILLIDSDQE